MFSIPAGEGTGVRVAVGSWVLEGVFVALETGCLVSVSSPQPQRAIGRRIVMETSLREQGVVIVGGADRKHRPVCGLCGGGGPAS